jgi:hypothetical protein
MTTRHILLYSGVSLLSRKIQFWTWSLKNHIAYVLQDYRIVDMWRGGGRIIDHPWQGHHDATRVWLADVRMEDYQAREVDRIMEQMPGKGYAYGQIIGFLARRTPRAYRGHDCHSMDIDQIRRFVCSGAVQYAFCRAGRPLVNKPWYKTDPSDIAESTELEHKREITGMDWRFWVDVWKTHEEVI